MEKCKLGDRNSQYELYQLYVNAMFNIAMRMLDTREDAEDIIQESFVDAFKKINSFRYESTFGSWLKRIVINKCINFLKLKKIPFSNIEDHEYHLTPEISDIKKELDLTKVKKGIKLLPKGFKQIITLYLIEGYDHIEIGEILGIATSTSKSQYHRAKKKLIEIINTL